MNNTSNVTVPYTITNMVGQVVGKGTIDSSNQNINVGNLSAGMYLFKVSEELRKFIIE